MVIQQVNPRSFRPVTGLQSVFVRDADAVPTNRTHRQFDYDDYEGGEGHNDYFVSGNNVLSLEVHSQQPANSIDLSSLPIIKRVAGVNSVVYAKFTNGRGISGLKQLDFLDSFEPSYLIGPTRCVAGSYAEYSLNRVKTVFGGLSRPDMFDNAGNRAHTGIIPHENFTCHAYGGPWGLMGGLRFTAITPRHMVGVAHYGYQVGDTIQFRTIGNLPVYRSIQAIWNPSNYTQGEIVSDFQIFLLNSDLPQSINPAPIVGDWFSQVQSGTDTTVYCPQNVGLTLWNNDGHITPSGNFFLVDQTSQLTTRTIDTVELNAVTTAILPEARRVSIVGEESLNHTLPTNSFFHNRRAGDSGSPCFAPVENGWALCGIVSGNLWTAPKINEAISRVDFHAGVTTGYTVTVATDPTL